ncbi:MAG: hypothetical protein RL557_40 [archaeon]|jgi:hypothetical protein
MANEKLSNQTEPVASLEEKTDSSFTLDGKLEVFRFGDLQRGERYIPLPKENPRPSIHQKINLVIDVPGSHVIDAQYNAVRYSDGQLVYCEDDEFVIRVY